MYSDYVLLLSWLFFLCSVFIMSRANATTAQPVTFMCSNTSSVIMNVTMGPAVMGLPACWVSMMGSATTAVAD